MSLAAKLVRPSRPNPKDLAPVPYVSRRTGMGLSFPTAERGSRTDQMAAMLAVPTLFAVVHKLSTGVAGTPWGLYNRAKSGKEEDRTEVTRHAALDLLRKPNPWMPWTEFCEVTQQHIDLTGEGWWVIARHPMAPSIPMELWPVRPDRMEPDPDPKDYIEGYNYITPDGGRIRLEVDDVIQIRMPNPLDMYRGLGPVQALLVDLDSSRYTAEWNRNFFKNSAEPGGVIQVEGRLDDTEFNELRDRWAEQHKGVANAHRVAILERGKWVDRKFSMRDMQFADLRKLSRDQILEGFGFPKVMLGATDGVNLANALAGEYMFAKWLVKTRLDRIKGAIDNELLPKFGPTTQNTEWDYESPVPEDRDAENAELKTKVDAFSVLVSSGVEPNNAAEIVGLPEVVMKAVPQFQPQPVPGLPPGSQNGHRRREAMSV